MTLKLIGIDRVEQYKRHNMVKVSGSALPPDNQSENLKSVMVLVIKENLKDDIDVAHRLGPVNDQDTRPITV